MISTERLDAWVRVVVVAKGGLAFGFDKKAT